MGTLFRWLAGLAGLAGLVKLLRRRRAGTLPERDTEAIEPDPAEELKRRLADAREQPALSHLAATSEPEPAYEPESESEPMPLTERRARLHAKAQETIESMRTDT
jgi:hypothetical protein